MTEVITSKYRKSNEKLDKESINIIRTMQRNNVQLIHIADNKAAVMLSLNAIILTLLIPNVISNLDFILENLLYVPIIIFAATSFCTVCISSFVLMPEKFQNPKYVDEDHYTQNPFFFGNILKMEFNLYFGKLRKSLDYKKSLQEFLAQDLYYSGKRLAYKMSWIRIAFYIFLVGISLAALSVFIALFT